MNSHSTNQPEVSYNKLVLAVQRSPDQQKIAQDNGQTQQPTAKVIGKNLTRIFRSRFDLFGRQARPPL